MGFNSAVIERQNSRRLISLIVKLFEASMKFEINCGYRKICFFQSSYVKESSGSDATSLIFSVKEGVGTLAGALDVFKVLFAKNDNYIKKN